MFKYIKYGILFAGLTLAMPACNDNYLNRYPLEGPSAESFFSNESELLLAVNGAYKAMTYAPSDGMPVPLLLDVVTDISWDRNKQRVAADR